MLFNSFTFLIFFLIVFTLYWQLPHKWQNRLLIVASYIFYGTWNWRFLFLLFLTTSVDYFCSLKIKQTNDRQRKKIFLIMSICSNLLALGFFKYFNFFVNSFTGLLGLFHLSIPAPALHIILPVGLSFYVFQSIGYTVDVYRGHAEPPRHFKDFALFVSFFPQLVAGPIERAHQLLPQILNQRVFSTEQFKQGLFLICLGLFQKIYVADNLAGIANTLFSQSGTLTTPDVLIAMYAFAFQIYCDFAGYSNIARGTANLLGFNLVINFNLPYFSKNPSEFWQRWHISLSNWLKDYLYIPLGGNQHGLALTLRNLMITMFLGGLWHGAAWTFVIWGLYQGLLLILYRLFDKETNSCLWTWLKTLLFFHLICLGWLVFRCKTFPQCLQMLVDLFKIPHGLNMFESIKTILSLLGWIWPILLFETMQLIRKDLFFIFRFHWVVQGVILFIFLFLITTFGAGGSHEFIYFQF